MAQPTHLELIGIGRTSYPEWRMSHPTEILDLSGCTDEHFTILPQNLSLANLTDCTLNHVSWHDEHLSDCDYSGSEIHKCWGTKSTFFRVRFAGATLREAMFSDCVFEDCIMSMRDTDQIQLLCRGLGNNMCVGGDEIRLVRRKNSDLSHIRFFNCTFKNVDLSCALMNGAEFTQCEMEGVVLDGAFLSGSQFTMCNLKRASLKYTYLNGSALCGSILDHASLDNAMLFKCDLAPQYVTKTTNNVYDPIRGKVSESSRETISYPVTFRHASLRNADLRQSRMVDVDFSHAVLSKALVHGISAWNNCTDNAIQESLVITRADEPTIEVDDIEVAQFVYLVSTNSKLRTVIDQITSKVVLLLGRFDADGLVALDCLRSELRLRGFLPVVFNWERSASRDLTETVRLISGMARYVIVDISNPRCSPHEFMAIVHDWDSLPCLPIIRSDQDPYAMFGDIRRKQQVLPLERYGGADDIVNALSGWLSRLETKRAEIIHPVKR